ncbi:hypothetical protein DQ04_01041140 [Trypanosoma grayi]|uniref:hypothetical protein n=1 Tax=Trypanosoma grayi TaxID=71804 RepID=UPI0004F49AA9|nr:hypothetical protein DQ04_01041140 [Trypanosoma grayi]KEG13384.1 hypothetical protein DQ04_01041140 [Trypanosoma grayi]
MATDASTAAKAGDVIVHDRYSTLSLVQLLEELSNSLACSPSLKYRRGDCGMLPMEEDALLYATTTSVAANTRLYDPIKWRRKRRRDALDAFFDSAVASASSPASLRRQSRQLFRNAKHNIGRVTGTHAAMLELLCSAVAPGIECGDNTGAEAAMDASEMSEAEQMLYIVLRTSVVAAPTWQKPPVVPRCWLSPSITALVERAPALQQAMRWSCDPDPVIGAALCVDAAAYNHFSLSPPASCGPPALLSQFADAAAAAWPQAITSSWMGSSCGAHEYWINWENEEVRHLFAKKRSSTTDRRMGDALSVSPHIVQEMGPAEHVSSPSVVDVGRPTFSIFKEEYPAQHQFCSLLFVALHRGIVGQQDPYLLLRLDGGSPLGSVSSPSKPPSVSQIAATPDYGVSTTPLCIEISPEFLVTTPVESHSTWKTKNRGGGDHAKLNASGRDEANEPQCSRGVMAMLQWSCQSGTLFLRLKHLCEVSERREWRTALGQYGKSAIEALRRLLLLLQGLVAEMADRSGGPHCVSFRELLAAQQKLRCVADDITALSDVFLVSADPSWEAAAVLGEISSATLLSSLYRHYAQRTANTQGRGSRLTTSSNSADFPGVQLDVIGDVFLAVLHPLHRMMGAWLRVGEVHDPYDEFFIVPSHGTTACGFLVDPSPQRLPDFISAEAAEEILHAGVSLRVLRAAARHVTLCATKEQKRLERLAEDVDAAAALQGEAEDAMGINWLLQDFLESLLGQRSPSPFLPVPEVDLLLDVGAVQYWRAFYGACNGVLLAASEEADGAARTVLLQDDAPLLLEDGEATVKSTWGAERSAGFGVGGAASATTNFSRISRATSVWHEAVSAEIAQVSQATSEEEAARTRARVALRSEYERRVLRRKAQRQLQQWKEQRLSLNLERAAALSRTVDELLELYARVLKPAAAAAAVDEKSNEEEEEKSDYDGRRTPIGKFVKPLPQPPSLPPLPSGAAKNSSAAVGRPRFSFPVCTAAAAAGAAGAAVGGDSVLLHENEESFHVASTTSLCRIIMPPRLRRASRSKAADSSLSLQSIHKDPIVQSDEPHEFVHPPEMYVVASINDDEYLMKRTGPHVTDTTAAEALFAQLAAEEARVRNYDVSSEAYQRECAAVAMEVLHGDGSNSSSSSVTAGSSRRISAAWWTDPTADEGILALFSSSNDNNSNKNTTTPALAPRAVLSLTEQQEKRLLHCSYYYLTLARYTAGYLTHKALQVMLLGPYGNLYRLTQQLLDVCLMQRGRVADRLTGLWQHLTREAIEENQFRASAVFTSLNKAFVEEWESCVLHGRDTLRVQLALTLSNDSDDDLNAAQNEASLTCNEESESGLLFHDTAFRRRTRRSATPHTEAEAHNEEEQQYEEKGGSGSGSSAVGPLPENPFDFISRLTIVHDAECGGLWVLPKHAVTVYGDLFSTLLFWASVMELVTRVWRIGITSGVAEAFFFCNVSRSVLNAVAQHMWFLIAGYVRAYRHTLRFESGVLYGYRQLESFTADHAEFLEHCRFAAMLTPVFARARQQVYGMVRQLEEVEQCVLRARAEDAADAAAPQDGTGRARKKHSDKAHKQQKPKSKKNQKIEVWEKGRGSSDSNSNRSGASPSLRRQKESSPLLPDMSPKSKRKSQRSADQKKLQQEDLKRRKEVRWRGVRDALRRRLRSFMGLTEIFIGHLVAVRESVSIDLEPTESPLQKPSGDHDDVEHAAMRDTTARVSALTSLIHTLEMTQAAVDDKL